MVKAKAGAAPADDGRKPFELDEQRAESLRSAIEAGPGEGPNGDPVAGFWERMGREMGFEPDSIILPALPEKGPAPFTAIPTLQGAVEQLGRKIEERDAGEGGEQMPAIARLERIAEESLPEGRALVRFTTMFILDQIKHSPRWDDLLEAQQRDLGAAIQQNSELLVERLIQAVRANGVEPIRALLKSYSEDNGIKAVLIIKPEDDEAALQAIVGLHRAQGKHVLITVASAQDFDQVPAEIEVDPDERELGFEPGSDHPNDDSDLAGD